MNDRLDPGMPRFEPMRQTAADYYGEKVRQFGATARGVDWNSEQSQIMRFEQLLRAIDDRDFGSINDFGCGCGALASYLRETGNRCRYTGFDISEQMIAHAVAAHDGDPTSTFTSDPAAILPADYTFASGVFNVKQDHGPADWQDYVLATLGTLNRLSTRGFAFNLLSSYSDPEHRRGNLFYGVPAVFFDYCKMHFSPCVALLHDYPLYEFTIAVRK